MRLLWILLPILAQGALALFDKQPPAELVVHQGEDVTLECITNSDVQCAWKLEDTALGLSGFLNLRIPQNLQITAQDSASSRDCTIVINNVDDRYNGNYICSPFTDRGQVDAIGTAVIVAKKPQGLRFLDNAAQGFPLDVSTSEPATVKCMAELARPKAEILWFLDSMELRDSSTVEDTPTDEGLISSVSTLSYQFRKEDNGKSLRCRANHVGYDAQDEADREREVDVNVQFVPYRPGGNKIERLYGYTAGQKGEVTLNFTANPAPGVLAWRVGDNTRVSPGSESLDGRFTSSSMVTKNASRGLYTIKLTIDPVMMDDQSRTFALELENPLGAAELEFEIGIGAAPPPPALSSTTIAIVAILVALLVIITISLVIFARVRGKWCFAAKMTAAGSNRSDTESTHDEKTDKPEKKSVKFSAFFSSLLKGSKADVDVEMAENKDETRELTKPDGEADGEAPAPPKKEGEVVYAELMLNSDGVKTEVRPSAEKTEYAVIVGTKTEGADGAAEDNKAKE